MISKIKIVAIFLMVSNFFAVRSTYADVIRDIHFPLDTDEYIFLDNFGEARGGGHIHEGEDILADKMTPLLSAVDGRVTFLPVPEPSWGYGIFITDDEGYQYRYIHVNNDTPGTDDGNGGSDNAYAPGIERGVYVTRGQHIGWSGDSGNAESVFPHLHFEIRLPDGTPIDPLESLQASINGSGSIVAGDIPQRENETSKYNYDPDEEKNISVNINIDKQINNNPSNTVCISNALIKSSEFASVYYCGADGKRYVFPDQKTFGTWYDDFSDVLTLSPSQIAKIPIGGNVTYRPGIKMVKIQTDPKTYAVARGGVLRWIPTEAMARELYGADWAKKIQDIPDAFFINYLVGGVISPNISQ